MSKLTGEAGKRALKQVKGYALSDDDLRKVLGDSIKIWNYPDLKDVTSTEQLFDDQGRAILLYPNNGRTSGHWTCLINKKDGIHYFDSYGEKPEEPKEDVPIELQKEWGTEFPDLTRILRASGKPVYSNTHQFQSGKPDIATCGRHCAVRLLYAPYSNEKYASIIKKSGLSADDFVTGVIFKKLGK